MYTGTPINRKSQGRRIEQSKGWSRLKGTVTVQAGSVTTGVTDPTPDRVTTNGSRPNHLPSLNRRGSGEIRPRHGGRMREGGRQGRGGVETGRVGAPEYGPEGMVCVCTSLRVLRSDDHTNEN